MHMLQAEDHLCGVESYFGLTEDVVLRKVIMQVAAVH